VSEAELPARRDPRHAVTVDDVRQLMGASTPHFALQLRNRIGRLVEPLPADHPARRLGELEIARLTRLGFSGEVRGTDAPPGMKPLAAVDDAG